MWLEWLGGDTGATAVVHGATLGAYGSAAGTIAAIDGAAAVAIVPALGSDTTGERSDVSTLVGLSS
jgi:hypothetical protein